MLCQCAKAGHTHNVQERGNVRVEELARDNVVQALIAVEDTKANVSARHPEDVKLTKTDDNRQVLDDNEGRYEGEVAYGMKQGVGCYLWHNGNFYNGEWKEDVIEGIGTLYYSRGGKLRGKFSAGLLHGLGRGLYSNGDCYVGMWRRGKYAGKGVYYVKEKDEWILGEFEDGALVLEHGHGHGKPRSLSKIMMIISIILEITARDSQQAECVQDIPWEERLHFNHYNGEIRNGMRHGNGSFMFSNGSYYEGQWRHNLPNGLGIFYYADGKYDAGTYQVLNHVLTHAARIFGRLRPSTIQQWRCI